VVLAVHELRANAIRRGAGRDGCASGRLRIWNLVRELCCQVDDGDPPDGHRQILASSMSSTPGHGLWLARQVADRMSMVSGPVGTRVRVAFNLS
jgi:hypothetical protein